MKINIRINNGLFMLIRNYGETRRYACLHPPESMYIVRPQYEYGMYKVTQS